MRVPPAADSPSAINPGKLAEQMGTLHEWEFSLKEWPERSATVNREAIRPWCINFERSALSQLFLLVVVHPAVPFKDFRTDSGLLPAQRL